MPKVGWVGGFPTQQIFFRWVSLSLRRRFSLLVTMKSNFSKRENIPSHG
jgi:hypothetical protein